jgi:hypothetical protein
MEGIARYKTPEISLSFRIIKMRKPGVYDGNLVRARPFVVFFFYRPICGYISGIYPNFLPYYVSRCVGLVFVGLILVPAVHVFG